MDSEHTHTIVYIIHILDRQSETLAQLNEIYSDNNDGRESRDEDEKGGKNGDVS